MARIEDVEARFRQREQELASRRLEAKALYGRRLGEAYAGYALEPSTNSREREAQIKRFVEAVATALEDENHGGTVQALTVLVKAFEVRIETVARETNHRDARFGFGG